MPSKPENERVYAVTILNWEKYQRPLKGNGGAAGRRRWVAISVDLYSDPDFIKLDSTHRECWIGMLLHAGKVGPTFCLSPANALRMFCLRRTPVFEVLRKQGFIKCRKHKKKPLIQNKEDKTIRTLPSAVGNGADAPTEKPPRPDKSVQETMIWDAGVKLLGGRPTDRSHLGKLIRDHGKDRVAEAIAKTITHRPVEPRAYLVAILQDRPANASNLQKNITVLQEWLDGTG